MFNQLYHEIKILMVSIILAVIMVGTVSTVDTISVDSNTLKITENNVHTTDDVGSFIELKVKSMNLITVWKLKRTIHSTVKRIK